MQNIFVQKFLDIRLWDSAYRTTPNTLDRLCNKTVTQLCLLLHFVLLLNLVCHPMARRHIDIVIRDSYVREYGNYSLKGFDTVQSSVLNSKNCEADNYIWLSMFRSFLFFMWQYCNRKERDQWGNLGVDGWIILGWISRRWDVGMWTGLGWPRIETGGVSLWVR